MIFALVLSLATPTVWTAPLAAASNVVGAYLLIDPVQGPSKLAAVAAQADTLPINRVTLSFLRPDMVYQPGSKSLVGTGFNYANSGDYGFAEIATYVKTIQAAGVDVFISMGGWDYNCWPYAYLYYSINPYGGSNAKVITQYGGGKIENCNASNQWCYACEPPSNGDTLDSYAVFPEPAWSSTWQQAQAYVAAKASPAVVWHPNIYGGQNFTDPKTGRTETVLGRTEFATLKRDPYQDLVYLAKDLGLAGIDIDYEEFWHADMFKTGDAKCAEPCQNFQTTYKYTAILKDVAINVANIYPTLKVSTAAAAVGAWNGDWWGGNLKTIWYNSYQLYPDVTKFLTTGTNAGGLNVMTYDISEASDECPSTGVCSLSQQVDFYMGTYKQMLGGSAGVYVGYEIGTPAYPNADQPQYMANLTASEFSKLQSATQSQYPGGFYWEMFKAADSTANVDVNTVSQKLCSQLLPGQSRCSGNLPPIAGSPTPSTSAPGPSTIVSTKSPVPTSIVSTKSSVTSQVPSPSTTTSTTKVATSSSGPVGTPCYPAWSAAQASNGYSGGAQVSDNGSNWVANWWSNQQPSVSTDGSWTNKGACGGPTPSAATSSVAPSPTPTLSSLSSVKTSASSAKPSQTSTKPSPSPATSATAGKIANGADCTSTGFGKYACSNACICNYATGASGAYVLQWQCTPTTATC
ncbi:hypothetical protein BC830DRAFT_1079975 [Chytriomyces sp. MP71]|nr:hypothetical protein BC830DRAFT_1079975 [Chytriomyces sp. MP71]